MAERYGFHLLRLNKNYGWSGGNNRGVEEALRGGARYVVLANNDIRVHPRWIAEAVTIAETRPDIGVIGFDVHEPQPGDTDRDAGYSTACREWSSAGVDSGASVGGMAMLVRAAVFEELGLIDENFWAYGEENDLQLRARRAGYEQVQINVPVWHHGSASFGRMPFRASLLQTQNNIQLLLKHDSLGGLAIAALRHVRRRVILSGTHENATTSVERRLQSRSHLQAAAVLVLAALRIMLQVPSILRRRAQDQRLIETARARRVNATMSAGAR
jgi:GT2 family glycosyltransferase